MEMIEIYLSLNFSSFRSNVFFDIPTFLFSLSLRFLEHSISNNQTCERNITREIISVLIIMIRFRR